MEKIIAWIPLLTVVVGFIVVQIISIIKGKDYIGDFAKKWFYD